MATFVIHSIGTAGLALCSKRREHVLKAEVEVPGKIRETWNIDQLIEKQVQGDNYILDVSRGPLDCPRVDFVECECGTGYLLLIGPTAVDLTADAMNHRDH